MDDDFIALLVDDDIARKHQSDLGIHLESAVGEGRIAGAEDAIRRAIDAELRLERAGDIDLGQDAEPSDASAFGTRSSASSMDSFSVVFSAFSFIDMPSFHRAFSGEPAASLPTYLLRAARCQKGSSPYFSGIARTGAFGRRALRLTSNLG